MIILFWLLSLQGTLEKCAVCKEYIKERVSAGSNEQFVFIVRMGAGVCWYQIEVTSISRYLFCCVLRFAIIGLEIRMRNIHINFSCHCKSFAEVGQKIYRASSLQQGEDAPPKGFEPLMIKVHKSSCIDMHVGRATETCELCMCIQSLS